MYCKRLTARWTVADGVLESWMRRRRGLGSDLQKNILRQSYDNVEVTIDLRQTSDLQNTLPFSGTIHSQNCKIV